MDGLETVDRCPVCGGAERSVLYANLTDRIFFSAPGRWTLHRCENCGSAFLDPRPDRATIGLAYGAYYTHDEGKLPDRPVAANIRDAIRNGYLHARYGYDLGPSSRLGPLVAGLLPKRRWYADHMVRHLERKPGGRLLDVGSGNAAFLAGMKNAGWDVEGLEPDPEAAERSRRGGIPVAASTLEESQLEPASFDAVTLNHVIEHLHDPPEALRICRRVLKPGGTLWLATPNLDARGHAIFGRDWTGLDPPRHLVLFTRGSLVGAVERAGFAVRRLPTAYMADQTFPASAAVAAGRPIVGATADRRLRPRVIAADLLVRFAPGRAEDVALIAEAV